MESATIAIKIEEVKGTHKAIQIPRFLASCRAAARTLLKERYSDGLEHFGILSTDAAWELKYPDTERPAFPAYPDMHAPNASQAGISVYKEEKELSLAVGKARSQLTTAILGALDPVDLGSLFDIDTGHADVTPADIIDFMVQAHGTITDADIEYAKGQTMLVYNPATWSVTNWIADKVQGYRFLESINCGTSDPDQYRNLLTAARNSPSLKRIIEKYLSDTEMGDRTFVHLKNFLVTQWAKTQTTGNPMRAAYAGGATVIDDPDTADTSESAIAKTAVAALATPKRSAEDYEKEIAALKGALKTAELYCFSCGYGGHKGTSCKRMSKQDPTGSPSAPKPRIPRSPYTEEMLNSTEPNSLKDADGKTCKGNVGVEKGYRRK